MADFAVLETAIRRNTVLALAACLILTGVTVVSLIFAFSVLGNSREMRLRMPVLVVPGAIGGVYSLGLTEENVRSTARYLTGLATNFTGPQGFRDRFDEIETFASPQFLPALRQARTELQRDVETQNQARAFFAASGTEKMNKLENGTFDYFVSGERMVYASGILMNTKRSEAHLRLRWGSPSQKNPAGIVLDGFEIRDSNPEIDPSAGSVQ